MVHIKYCDGINLSQLECLGYGTQGIVYKIDNTKCIKVFKKKKYCQDELHSLLISQIDSHFPKLYSYGDNYIIRQYIDGITLDSYISENSLNDELSEKIIEIYNSMYYVGFKRLDFALFHVFLLDGNISSSGKVMLIDTAKAMKKTYTYPYIVLNSLKKLNYKQKFLDYVQNNHPDIYEKWNS